MNKIYDPVDVNDAKALHAALIDCVRDCMADRGMPDKSTIWILRESINFAAVLIGAAMQALTYFYFLPFVRYNVLVMCVGYYICTYLSAYIERTMEANTAVITRYTPERPYIVRIEVAPVPDTARVRLTFSTYPHTDALKGTDAPCVPYRYAGKYSSLTFCGIATEACTFERGWGTYFTREGNLYVPQVLEDVEFGLKGVSVPLEGVQHVKQD